jgi:hypothetical protein
MDAAGRARTETPARRHPTEKVRAYAPMLHLTLAQQFSAEMVSFNNVSTGTLSGLFA